MQFAGIFGGRIGRFLAILLISLVLAGSMAPRAEAQSFSFTFSGTTLNGDLHSVAAVLFATLNGGNNYTVNSLTGTHTINGVGTANNMSLDATPSLASLGVLNNQIFVPNGGSTIAGASGHFATFGGGVGWTRSGVDYAVGGDFFFGDAFSASNNTDTRNSLITGSDAGTAQFASAPSIVVPVPGPLAGAGMLSWLAVVLMGLFFGRNRLMARLRGWRRMLRSGKARMAQTSAMAS